MRKEALSRGTPWAGEKAMESSIFSHVLTNAAVLAALKLGAPLCSLLLVLAVSSRLGAEGLGRYSLAYAFLTLFGLCGPLGLPSLLTREGARNSQYLGRLLGSGLLLGGSLSLLLTVAMGGLGRALHYDPQTTRSLAVLGLALAPSTFLTYFDAAFLALQRTLPMAVAAIAEQALKVGAGIILLVSGYGLDAVLAAAVAGRVLACLISIAWLRRLGVSRALRPNLGALRMMVSQAPVFALSAVCATLYWRIDVFLLSKLRTLTEVGLYTAAYRVLDLAILLPQSLCHALFPGMAADPAGEAARRARALAWLGLLTIPVALAVTAVAFPLLGLLFGSAIAPAAPTLSILIWTAVPYAWSRYFAHLLVAAGRQRTDLAINAAILAVNTGMNLAAIPRHGGKGAAVVTLATALLYGAAQFACLRRGASLAT